MSTSTQLNEMVRVLGIKDYVGYFSRDEIPFYLLKNRKKYCFLCNFEKSSEPGSHHVAFWKDNSDYRYFDSFGGPVLNEIRELVKGKEIWNYQAYDDKSPDVLIQDANSNLCGEWSVLFLFLCDKGYSFPEIIKFFIGE